MSPDWLRLLMVMGGAACVVAATLLPSTKEILMPAGVGLIAWAAPAPGHGKAPDAPAGGSNAGS